MATANCHLLLLHESFVLQNQLRMQQVLARCGNFVKKEIIRLSKFIETNYLPKSIHRLPMLIDKTSNRVGRTKGGADSDMLVVAAFQLVNCGSRRRFNEATVSCVLIRSRIEGRSGLPTSNVYFSIRNIRA